jgi:hypothetical protein
MSDSGDKPEFSQSGSRIYRHGQPSAYVPAGPPQAPEQISNHIENHLGKCLTVFHEIVSDTVHVDVHPVDRKPGFPFYRLVTSGMSDLPMIVPEGTGAPRYVELLMTLPESWKMTTEAFQDENWYWPVRLIKTLATLPHKYSTWLGLGHTVPNGDPLKPHAHNRTVLRDARPAVLGFPAIPNPENFK